MFLIVSSSVYPAIISDIHNKEMTIIADAFAQLQEKISRGDSSGYHANIPVSDRSSPSPSPTPTTAAPSSIASTGIVNNNKDFATQWKLKAIESIQMSSPAGVKLPGEEFSKLVDTLIDDYNIKNMVTKAINPPLTNSEKYPRQQKEEAQTIKVQSRTIWTPRRILIIHPNGIWRNRGTIQGASMTHTYI